MMILKLKIFKWSNCTKINVEAIEILKTFNTYLGKIFIQILFCNLLQNK